MKCQLHSHISLLAMAQDVLQAIFRDLQWAMKIVRVCWKDREFLVEALYKLRKE
jgi:hypothetical protein